MTSVTVIGCPTVSVEVVINVKTDGAENVVDPCVSVVII